MALRSQWTAVSPAPGAAPAAFHGGFETDLAHDRAFRGLTPVRDALTPLSPLVTRRDVILEEGGTPRVRILVFVAGDDAADARRALAAHFAGLALPPALAPGAEHLLALGDFAVCTPTPDGPARVAFGRGNVAVDVAWWGTPGAPLAGIARNLDEQLAASPTFDRGELDARKPRIDAFRFGAASVAPGGTTPLVLAAACPAGGPLRFDFATSGGAVNVVASAPPRFAYESGPARGAHQITAYVTARSALTTVARLDFGIGDDPFAP